MNEPGSQMLTQLSDSSKPSLDEEFLKLSDMKTFEQIRAMDEKSCCVVLGTIIQIPEGNNWWYKACKCNKKVIWDEKIILLALALQLLLNYLSCWKRPFSLGLKLTTLQATGVSHHIVSTKLVEIPAPGLSHHIVSRKYVQIPT
ncbi:uncharacterized protein LOC130742672 [Lotus japonicus]|uniref:uncharacterized protein LOC130742672 n=1 Tax=Lotus japonicus TaxID=34305 RepID=UPI00258AC558|nr:uncharacterized protein LOC130742672 [Lotus japonicus]